MLTYWLLGATDSAIKKKKPDVSKLKPLFSLPKLGVGSSVEMTRRRSPRMSMISGADVRQSFRDRGRGSTPDSRRQSRVPHESGHSGDHRSLGDGADSTATPAFDQQQQGYGRSTSEFHPRVSGNRAMAAKLLSGLGRSPRMSLRGPGPGSSLQIHSSQGSLSSHKSRPRSLSEDRRGSQDLFESVALLTNGDPTATTGNGEMKVNNNTAEEMV